MYDDFKYIEEITSTHIGAFKTQISINTGVAYLNKINTT